MDPVWQCHIVRSGDGSHFFDLEDMDGLIMYCGRFEVDAEMELILRKRTKSTSTPQMRYYYGVVCKMISDETGHSPDEVDSMLKWKFLRRKDDQNIEYVPSKNDLTTGEFQDFLDSARRWAAGFLELSIPEPNEVDYAEKESRSQRD